MDPSSDYVDPRVQVELENLNTSTEFINKLELELKKARLEFNNLLNESTMKIESLTKKLGNSIQKARPYYETKQIAQELHEQAQRDALRYEMAINEQQNVKEIVQLAEKTLNNDKINNNDDTIEIDVELEQLLTKSAEKFNQSEIERKQAELQHLRTSQEYSITEQNLLKLHNQLKRSIVKASMETRRNFLELNNYANQHRLQLLPYFEMKSQFNQMLDEQVMKIRSYEQRVNKAKNNYSNALQRLEELNNKIYNENRKKSVDNDGNLNEQHDNDDVGDIGDVNEKQEQNQNQKQSSSSLINDKIFDNELLDQLILTDEQIDNNIDMLKIDCLK